MRPLLWSAVVLALLAFFLVRHFTRTMPDTVHYSLIDKGRALLGLHALAFDGGGSLLVANIADPSTSYLPGHTPPPGGLPDSKSWAVLAVDVDDTAGRLFRPDVP